MEQQHQQCIDAEDADDHRGGEAGENLGHKARFAGLGPVYARRQVGHRGQLVDQLQRITQRQAAAVGRDGDVAAAVIARDLRRTGTEADIGHVHQRYGTAACRHRQQLDLLEIATRRVIKTHADGHLTVRQIHFGQVIEDVAAGRDACYLRHGCGRYAQFCSAFAQRPDDQFGCQQAGAGSDRSKARDAAHLPLDVRGGQCKHGRVFTHQLDRQTAAAGCATAATEGQTCTGHILDAGHDAILHLDL